MTTFAIAFDRFYVIKGSIFIKNKGTKININIYNRCVFFTVLFEISLKKGHRVKKRYKKAHWVYIKNKYLLKIKEQKDTCT